MRTPSTKLTDIRRRRFAAHRTPVWVQVIRLKSDHWRPRPVDMVRAEAALRRKGVTMVLVKADGSRHPAPRAEVQAMREAIARVARLLVLEKM